MRSNTNKLVDEPLLEGIHVEVDEITSCASAQG
jgi:hypothetical protein